MNKKLILGLAMLVLATSANAGHRGGSYTDRAKVLDVEPIYRTVEITTPKRTCWEEDVSYYEPGQKSYTGTVLGSIIGGVLVSEMHRGRGKGKDAAVLAGALMGGALGHDLSRNQRTHGHYSTQTEQRCDVEHVTTYEEELVGYRVKYLYEGQVFTTRTEHHPGKWIKVRVGVTPLDES